MKHTYRITLAMMVLSLLLSVGSMVQAQEIDNVTQNSDCSYDQAVIEAFRSYMKSVETLPTTDEEIGLFVEYFFAPYRNEYGVIIIKKEDGGEASPKEIEEISQSCITLLKQNAEQVQQQNETPSAPKESTLTNKQIGIIAGLIVLVVLVIVVILLVRSKKKKKKNPNNGIYSSLGVNTTNNSTSYSSNDVIIRRKTTSVIHRLSLDDVINNNNYLAIDCNDIYNDTAVKNMYIKNTCIIDIYNMYAEDLRNPDNPKEDGCMVLGRWIHDEKLDEYSVSLEEVVLPGDDAVFAEYELDFGGKIKVKVNEKLRKLRRETDLQYDLTCWVHSHPGLGVFFSKTDCNLHLLHKHPSHPKFLTALVIDILTPQQELGIFTFKHDLSINSQAELRKTYSLEEWYKWAVESKRNSTRFEERYNTLENAKSHSNQCNSVQLSNSTIIDMDLRASNQDNEHVYFVHGFTTQQSEQLSNIAVKIESTDTLADNELIGCFIIVSHRSIPSIKNAVADYLGRIRFVLVYSTTDNLLTTIPVIANDLCADESYYGEQPLEDLKIWTRRKR